MFNYQLLSSSGNDIQRNKKYLIFGDSHSKFFTRRKYQDLEIHLYRIRGASMAGFGKRESTLQVADTIRQTIYEHQNLDLLILKFGQVDVELGYYYRLIVKQEALNFIDFAEKIVSMYFDFINSLALEKKQIYILGINLPSIFKKRNAVVYTNQVITQNIQDKEQIKNFKKDLASHLPNIYERTNQSIIFNNLLKEYCHKYSIGYSDFTKETLDKKTGILNRKFHLPKDNDPHYRDSPCTRNLYAKKLKSINLEYEQSAKVKLYSQIKPLESEPMKLKQWQSRLDEFSNQLKEMQERLQTINYKL